MRQVDFADGFESSSAPTGVGLPATSVTVTPTGNLAADDVQEALVELQGDINTLNSGKISTSEKGAANGVAPLNASSKIDSSYLEAVAITDVYVVADDAARDALTVQEGDVAKVTGTGKSYIYDGSGWILLNTDDAVAAHEADTSNVHAAGSISNAPTGNLVATNVQAALDELQTDVDTRATAANLTAHTGAGAGAHAASAISNTPSGNLAASTVQAALNELQGDIDAISSGGYSVESKTASFSAAAGKLYAVATASGAVVATLPTAVGISGQKIFFVKTDSSTNTLTIQRAGAETINGATSKVVGLIFGTLVVVSDGANWVLEDKGFNKSYVCVHTGNGFGSTATKIRRLTTVKDTFGPDITWADSATAGGSATINSGGDGIYVINYQDLHSSAERMGLSLNSAQLTTAIQSITEATRLAWIQAPAGFESQISWCGPLVATDVVRMHTEGNSTNTTAGTAKFMITKVANL